MTRANKIVLTGALSVLVLSVGCKSSPPPSSTVATEASPGVSQSPKVPVIYLNQGWSQADREMYYWTSQGSTGFSYDIYLNMEVAGSQELFRSDANSERYGLITASRESADKSRWLADRSDQDRDCRWPLEGRVHRHNLCRLS